MYQNYLKRLFDIIIALLLLLLVTPFLLLIALCLLFNNPKGKLFFTQERVGYKEQTFRIIKFRSMTDKRDANGNLLPNEQRITRIGRAMRRSSIDELPQLWNILKGEMSFIGPRPLHTQYLPLYSKEQAKRHTIRPGMTGWAQCHGRNNITWTQKFELDIWYVNNYSFILDTQILFRTSRQLFSAKRRKSNRQEKVEFFNGVN